MTNQSARRNILASLETRNGYADAAREGSRNIRAARLGLLSDQYKAALLAGDPRADQYRQRGAAIINGYYQVEEN